MWNSCMSVFPNICPWEQYVRIEEWIYGKEYSWYEKNKARQSNYIMGMSYSRDGYSPKQWMNYLRNLT